VTTQLEKSWKQLNDAIDFETLYLEVEEIKELTRRLIVKAEYLERLCREAEE